MALYYETHKGRFVPWQPGKFIKAKLPGNIEAAWTDEELAARRLYRPLPAEPMPQGKLLTGVRVERIDGVVRYVEELADAPPPSAADYAAAVQGHLDAAAQARDYADIFAAVSYAVSSVPGWAADGAAFAAWRDAVWLHVYAVQGAVTKGERAQPTVAELIAELPALNL